MVIGYRVFLKGYGLVVIGYRVFFKKVMGYWLLVIES